MTHTANNYSIIADFNNIQSSTARTRQNAPIFNMIHWLAFCTLTMFCSLVNYCMETKSYHRSSQFQNLNCFFLVVHRYPEVDAFQPGDAAWVNTMSSRRWFVSLGLSIYSTTSVFCCQIFHTELRFDSKQSSVPKWMMFIAQIPTDMDMKAGSNQ